MKNLKDIKLLIATPCFAGLCNAQYTNSLIEFFMLAKKIGLSANVLFSWNSSLITKGRNDLANNFLLNTEATHLLFIDSDMEFRGEDIIKMLSHNKDLIGGTYPKKKLNFKTIEKFYFSNFGKNLSEQQILESCGDYALSIKDDEPFIDSQGVIEVDRLPTGFMLIKRNVFEKMKSITEQYLLDNDTTKDSNSQLGYAFFDTYINDKKQYISDDYSFCDRWNQLGGKVYVEPSLILNHIGSMNYKGNMLNKIKNWNYGKS